MAALFAALLAASAFVAVPLGSVPFTLQVYVVLLAGMILGPRLGVLSVAAYLVVGLIVPVYATGGSGLGTLFGPTGGYLLGFIPSVVVTGLLTRGNLESISRVTFAGLAGLAPIYLLGAAWLGLQLNLTLSAAITAGVAPFVWVDVPKALAAALTARALFSLPLDLPVATRKAR